MSKTLTITLFLCFFILGVGPASEAQVHAVSTPISAPGAETDRAQDGLNGPVRRVRLETAQIIVKDGKPVEGRRQLRGIATYDPKGRKIDAVAYPVDGDSLTGRERYRYDEKGNIIEMEVRDADGSILSKETYRYEFDSLGNWKKMTTSVALYENGAVSEEPIEISYRTIAYYYGAMEKLESGLKASESPTGDNHATNAVVKIPSPIVPTELQKKQLTQPAAVPGAANVKSEPAKTEPAAVTGVAKVKPEPPKTEPAAVPGVANVKPDPPKNEPATVPSVAKLKLDPPSTVSAGNGAVKAGDDGSVAAHVPARSEKVAAAAIPAAASSDHAVMTSKPEETSPSTALYEAGLTYLSAGSYDEANASFNQVVRANPSDAKAHAKLGLAYSGLRKFKEAIAVLNTAIRMQPEVVDARAYYYLGYSYSQLGLYTDAVAAFNKALYAARQEAVDNEDAKGQSVPAAQIYYELGVAHYGMKRYPEAIKELSEAVKLNPQFAEAYYGLALAYLGRGDRWSARKQQKPLSSLDAALAKKLADEIATSNFRENIPCASSGFCR